ncbi:hypothetical protein FRB94_011927 [Tulasnella sp. JGI-2019a]|nr:hypothetical protein FRB94_011927 [Tulasnella sp. JGI-2019a]KAG9024555.1 hypothetical protein FRB95_011353 [Tulasnella sp. JGI-2019a]
MARPFYEPSHISAPAWTASASPEPFSTPHPHPLITPPHPQGDSTLQPSARYVGPPTLEKKFNGVLAGVGPERMPPLVRWYPAKGVVDAGLFSFPAWIDRSGSVPISLERNQCQRSKSILLATPA